MFDTWKGFTTFLALILLYPLLLMCPLKLPPEEQLFLDKKVPVPMPRNEITAGSKISVIDRKNPTQNY